MDGTPSLLIRQYLKHVTAPLTYTLSWCRSGGLHARRGLKNGPKDGHGTAPPSPLLELHSRCQHGPKLLK